MSVTKALNLDPKAQRNFINFYNKKFSEEHVGTCLRIFERSNGDFYSIHGRDVDLSLKTSLKSSMIVKQMQPDELPGLKYVSMNKSLFEKLVRELLLVVGYRVEVFVQNKGKDDWKVEYKGSPGNMVQFEELLSSTADGEIMTNMLMCIQMVSNQQKKKLGVAFIDANERIVYCSEFEEATEFLTELEANVAMMSPKEAILPAISGEYLKVKEVLERNGVLVSVAPKAHFANNADFHQDIEKLVRFKKDQKKSIHTIPEAKLDIAMGSLAAGIKYLELINDESHLGKFQIQLLNLKRFVHLDTAAVSALNLFPPANVNYRSSVYKWQSVLGVLDRCKTNQGRRLLSQFIKQPPRNLEIINERLDIVQCFVENQEVRNSLHKEHLSSIPDILMLINKLSRKRAGLNDVFKIYQIVLRLPELVRLLKSTQNAAVKSAVVDRFAEAMQDLEKFEEMVEEVLDLKAVERGEYLIKASFDDALAEVKEQMDEVERKMKKESRKCAELLNLEDGSTLKLDFVSHLGFHFRSSRKEDSKLRQHKMFETIDTARGGIRFTTSKLRELNVDFQELRESYEEKQGKIVAEIVGVASGYSAPLMNLNNTIAHLDVFVSLSEVAANSPGEYVRPKMYPEEDRVLKIKTLRHPCLECQEDMEFIPNDVCLKEGETSMYIITGANISGKSTYVRSIGIAVLLAHIGSFVPCSEAEISVCDAIYARVGASDNIQKGLSTFMVEMVETASILQSATKSSLVIIDELGRGTSTFEGLGLAWSIAEHFADEMKCFTLFATHFHEITAMTETSTNAKNYHLAAITENGQLTLLFQVRPGPIDRSFGIQVAEIAQLPPKVLEDAKKYLADIEAEQRKGDNEKNAKIYKMFEEIQNGAQFDMKMLESL